MDADPTALISDGTHSAFHAGHCSPVSWPTGETWPKKFTDKVLEAIARLPLQNQIDLGAHIIATAVSKQKEQTK
jgi:hypothetical protein